MPLLVRGFCRGHTPQTNWTIISHLNFILNMMNMKKIIKMDWVSTMHRYHHNAGLMVDNHFEYSLAMVGCLKKHRKIIGHDNWLRKIATKWCTGDGDLDKKGTSEGRSDVCHSLVSLSLASASVIYQ